MTGWPIILRELRAEAQRPFNYWLRVIGAGVVIVFLWAFLMERNSRVPLSGALIFGYLHAALFLGIWLFVPLFTADCLSQEKREGTLGLLFLTRLTPKNIVGAKAMIHVLRAMTLLLAMVPAVLLPFLMGGIGWREAVVSLSLNLGAMLMALSAGICASAWCQVMVRAVSLSVVLSGVLSALFVYVFAWGFFTQVTTRIYFATSLEGVTAIGYLLATGTGVLWSDVFGKLTAAEQQAWVLVALEMLVLSALLFSFSISISARQMRRTWQQVPPTLKQLRFLTTFFSPRYYVASLKRRMSSSLSRNPIGWLQEYSWTSRAIKWGWLGVFGLTDAWLVSQQIEGGWRWRELLDAHFYLSLGLGLGMAASAVGSFRRERQNGVLELLLITPLTGPQIVRGRLYGIWVQFFPAALLLLVVWWKVLGVGPSYRWMPDFKWFFVSTFISLPVIGLWCSLLHKSFMVTWLLACFLGILLPHFLADWLSGTFRLYLSPQLTFGVTGSTMQIGLARWAWRRLNKNLEERTFALN